MRLLLIVRLYSGFRQSVASGEWAPTGAPTIYKLIEALERRRDELELVLVCKEPSSSIDDRQDRQIRIDGLSSRIWILGGEAALPRWLGRFRWYASELRQAWRNWQLARRLRPDLIYVDRGNLWSAALLARSDDTPVVYRIMGISPGLRDPFAGNKPRQVLMRWFLRSPFAAVICTQDGSGAEYWLDRMLTPGIPRHLWLNGVDPVAPGGDFDILLSHIPADCTRVLFVGRLDDLKGCREFIEAFLIAHASVGDRLHAVIVGDGPNRIAMQARVSAADAGRSVTFLGSVAHDRVQDAYRCADIYVSLNRMGNLSNANLEAMLAGCCMIVPAAQPETGADTTTELLFPDDTALRVPGVDDPAAIASAILQLHANPDERRRRGAATKAAADAVIGTWRQRIEREVDLLEELASGRDGVARLTHAASR